MFVQFHPLSPFLFVPHPSASFNRTPEDALCHMCTVLIFLGNDRRREVPIEREADKGGESTQQG